MKAIALCCIGTEKICEQEIKELANGKIVDKTEGAVVFEITNKKKLHKLAYLGQSFKRLMIYLGEFDSKKINFKKIDYSKHFKEEKKFEARAEIKNKDFLKQDIESELGAAVFEQNKKAKVDLKKPELTIFSYINKAV